MVRISKLEIDQMVERISSLESDCERLKSDFSKYKKRSQNEAEKKEIRVRQELGKELLVVLDTIDRGTVLDCGANNSCEYIETIRENLNSNLEITYNQLIHTIDLTPIIPSTGEKFDDMCHTAIKSVENNNIPDKTIISLVRKGYSLNGEIIRPAEVVMSTSSKVDEAELGQKKHFFSRLSNYIESIIFKKRSEELKIMEEKLQIDEGSLCSRARDIEVREEKLTKDKELCKRKIEELNSGFETLKKEENNLEEKIKDFEKKKKENEELLIKYKIYGITDMK